MTFISDAKTLAKTSLFYGGFYGVSRAWGKMRRKRLLILMYHDLGGSGSLQNMFGHLRERPTAEQFEAHLDLIGKRYRVVSVEQAMEEMRRSGELEESSVAITFDDGYASVYNIAFPLLKRYGMSATVYLTTDWIDRRMSLWWERLADMIGQADIKKFTPDSLDKGLPPRIADRLAQLSQNAISRMTCLAEIENDIRDRKDEEIQGIVNRLEVVLFPESNYQPREATPLSWDEIKAMAAVGINFGAHTCSHPNLGHIGLDQAEVEIAESKRQIESHIGRGVTGLVYPYGVDLETYGKLASILEKHDYRYACTALPGVNDKDSDPYTLWRTTLPLTESRALLTHSLISDFNAKKKIAPAVRRRISIETIGG